MLKITAFHDFNIYLQDQLCQTYANGVETVVCRLRLSKYIKKGWLKVLELTKNSNLLDLTTSHLLLLSWGKPACFTVLSPDLFPFSWRQYCMGTSCF